MTIIDKIKATIEPLVGVGNFHYADSEEMNVTLDSAFFPCAFSLLVETGTAEDELGRFHERVNIQVLFADLSQVGISGEDNERLLQPQKERALTWLSSLRSNPDLKLEAVNRTGRQYIKDGGYDVMITAFAVDVTISETEGYGEVCGK